VQQAHRPQRVRGRPGRQRLLPQAPQQRHHRQERHSSQPLQPTARLRPHGPCQEAVQGPGAHGLPEEVVRAEPAAQEQRNAGTEEPDAARPGPHFQIQARL